ncbi:hypothetical protein [Nocardioides sp. Soil805]|uniref:hypothetical protein n=1 Tax=Nocardioides sp. Soil805 TaxID=1736416 RepID=UPI000702D899|nr:hypothetical protein [Nocardioides sp. Soil805]KRF34929.1 hypothetical protein ASG94_12330 [Nocardioides sp. Soil805]
MSNQIRPLRRVIEPGDDVVLEIAVDADVTAYTWVVVARRPRPGGDPVAAHGWRPKSGTRRPPTSTSVTASPELTEGSYLVRLLAGKPAREADLSSFLSSAELLDSDTFTVTSASAADGSDVASSGPAFGSKPYLALRDAARERVGEMTVSDFRDLLPSRFVAGLPANDTFFRFPKLAGPPSDQRPWPLPAVELIWSYWLEEGMLVQTMDAIVARFQNRRQPGRDPLARFDLTPLLPLRNRLWGYAEDEVHRLTVRRRAAEYEYEYGLTLLGRGPARPDTPVERRSRFVEAFHQVLHLGQRFFEAMDNLALQSDGFPLCLALRDCHLILTHGTHNQYGEMAVASRAELLVIQRLLGEPELRQFLGGRSMTPYPEPWMDRVDAMRSIQGWGEASIVHFNDLATIGEQLVLTIRLGAWADPTVGAREAVSWAQAFRPEIQGYIAAYRAATGVDLAREPSAEQPATRLARRRDGAGDDGQQRERRLRDARQRAEELRALADEMEAEANRHDHEPH